MPEPPRRCLQPSDPGADDGPIKGEKWSAFADPMIRRQRSQTLAVLTSAPVAEGVTHVRRVAASG